MSAAGVIWLCGIPRAGKTTLGRLLTAELTRRGLGCQLLDSAELRRELFPDLGYSPAERRRLHLAAAWLAELLQGQGIWVVAALSAPTAALRAELRRRLPGLMLVHLDCGLEQAVNRDREGLYARGLAGEIRGVVGLDQPFEPPAAPDLRLASDRQDPAASLAGLVGWLERLGRVPPAPDPAYDPDEAREILRRLEELGYL